MSVDTLLRLGIAICFLASLGGLIVFGVLGILGRVDGNQAFGLVVFLVVTGVISGLCYEEKS